MQRRQIAPVRLLPILERLQAGGKNLDDPIDNDGLSQLKNVDQWFSRVAEAQEYTWLHAAISLGDCASVEYLIKNGADINKTTNASKTDRSIIKVEPLRMSMHIGPWTDSKGSGLKNHMTPTQNRICILLMENGAHLTAKNKQEFLDPAIAAGVVGFDYLAYQQKWAREHYSPLHQAVSAKVGIHYLTKLPDNLSDEKYKNTYIFVKETSKLYDISDSTAKPIRIQDINQFKPTLTKLMGSDNFKQLDAQQASSLVIFSPKGLSLYTKNAEECKRIIADGADVNELTTFGETALHLAAENKSLTCMEALFSCVRLNSSIVNVMNLDNQSALDIMHAAIKKASLQNISVDWKSIIALLLCNGAEASDEQPFDFITIGIDVAKHKGKFQSNGAKRIRSLEVCNSEIIADQRALRGDFGELVATLDSDITEQRRIIHDQRLLIGEQRETIAEIYERVTMQSRAIQYLLAENQVQKGLIQSASSLHLPAPEPERHRELPRLSNNICTFYGQQSDNVTIPRNEWEELKRKMASLEERVRQLEGNGEVLVSTGGAAVASPIRPGFVN
jgi:ankyrin repeat protein